MARPHVVTHALLSADGRLGGFSPDLGLYYELAGRLQHDAILAGSGTILAAAQAAGVDLSVDDESASVPSSPSATASLPMMVIVDSQGRLTRFDWLRSTGLWRDVLVLGSERTPSEHHERLRTARVELEISGDDKVDLLAALHGLNENYGIKTVRVDAGPGLNTVLLAAGLVDEISMLLAPFVVGHGRTLLESQPGADATQLTLVSAEPQPNGHVWLRYTVARA